MIRVRLWPATVSGRQRVRTLLMLAAAAGLGYLVTLLAYPAPLLPRDVMVARLLGLPLETAQAEATAQGFKVRLDNPEPDPVIPAGHVLWQDPSPGTALPEGATIRLIASSGPASVPVPDVIGFDLDAALQVVQAAGLRVEAVDSLVNAAEAGVVITTRPSTGASLTPGTGVELVVSRGLADIRVPDLLGSDKEEARRRLDEAGLKLGTIVTRQVRRSPSGKVVEQRPAAGLLSPRGGRVNIVISQ